jgi:hypothetical protein
VVSGFVRVRQACSSTVTRPFRSTVHVPGRGLVGGDLGGQQLPPVGPAFTAAQHDVIAAAVVVLLAHRRREGGAGVAAATAPVAGVRVDAVGVALEVIDHSGSALVVGVVGVA